MMTVATSRYTELNRQFPLQPIRNKAMARKATAILDELFSDHFDDPGEENYVVALAALLADYEDVHDPGPDTSRISGLETLRHAIENSRITQQQLANILGVSQPAVSQILAGKRPITADHARALGRHFRLDPGAFL
jgi:antitoxin component HigA of HigAB toxin-antitoxin module